jgi:hypothetical protein
VPSKQVAKEFVKDVVVKKLAETFVHPKQFAKKRFARKLVVPPWNAQNTEVAKDTAPNTELATRKLATKNVELPSFARSSENAEPSAVDTPPRAPDVSAPQNAKSRAFAENTKDVTRSAETKLFAETLARLEEFANITEHVERLVITNSVVQNYIATLSAMLENSAVTTGSVL